MRVLTALLSLLLVLILLTAHIFWTGQQLVHATEIARCSGEAADAWELNQQLLSRGRFVRKYNQATGSSIYTFQRK